MKLGRLMIIFTVFMVLVCYITTSVCAVSNETMNMVSEVNVDEFISVNDDEHVDDVDESVLSAQNENDHSNFNVIDADEILSVSNQDSLSVSNQETNQYLADIKTSTSDEYFKFLDYLIYQKGFKFNGKNSDDGYTIYSNSKYSCKLYDGENYILPAGNTYFISKNRMDYVIDEYYPDILYSQNGNTYVDELYLGWLKWVENYHFTITIEDDDAIYVNLDNSMSNGVNVVGDGTTIIGGNPIATSPVNSSNLPEIYDLRNVDGKNYVSSVKDQAKGGTCWIFAAIAALESHLLKTEGKTYDYSINYDFSENNLKNVMSNIGRQGINRTVDSGGNMNYALAYFLRWSGPILDEFDKYNLNESRYPINNVPIEFNNSAKHIQGIRYIHGRNSSLDNDEIKQSIMDYGGVVTSLWWLDSYEIKDNYYYNGLANEKDSEGKLINAAHEICIIGWNDTYSADNFYNAKLNIKPAGNGAFLIKNSWGDNYGDDGYYWVSYYDTQLAMRLKTNITNFVGFAFTLVENNTNYGKNYNYNPLGVNSWMPFTSNGNPAKKVTYYNQRIAEEDETLKAVGVYVHDACKCNIKVFLDNGALMGKATTTVSLNYAGFHTIS